MSILNRLFRESVLPPLAKAKKREKAEEVVVGRFDAAPLNLDATPFVTVNGELRVLPLPGLVRADVDRAYRTEVSVILAKLRRTLSAVIAPPPERIEPIGEGVERHVGRVFSAEAKAQGVSKAVQAAGADVFTASEVAAWSRTQAQLILQLGERYLDELEAITNKAAALGTETSEVVKQYQARFDVNQRRADFIARNEIGNLNAQLTEETHKAAGVEEFVWVDSGDDKVRDLHEEIAGQTFPYPQGHPTEGLPGQPFNCRCVAKPKIPGEVSIARGRLTTEIPPA
jgi:SPP1 gp7 family putative phage head morphogenesis protein